MSEGTGSSSQIVRVTLPSGGIPYAGAFPAGEVDVAAMTVDEWKLFTGAGTRGEERFNLLLSRCVRLPADVTPLSLLSGDRMFLFFEIRKVSLPGSPYGFRHQCEHCRREFRHEIDFAEIPVQRLADTWGEPFQCKLPAAGDILGLRVTRGSDEKAIAERVDRLADKMSEPGDPGFLFRLARHVVTVGGQNSSFADSEKYVKKLALRDMLAMQACVEANDCGPRMMIETPCPLCAATNEFALPVGKEFFRPRS